MSGTEDEIWHARTRPRPRPWSPRNELVASVRPPNRTIGHLYDAVLLHQRTCHLHDVTDLRDDDDDDDDDDEVSPSTKSTFCCCRPSVGFASRPKRTRFSAWTKKKKR